MNAHTPFDANQDWTNPYCQNSSNDPMVDALLGNAYHVVRTVYCNLGNLKLIYDFLNQYGMVLGVQSEAELKALTTKAKYARIYGFSRAGDRQVTDYLYVEGDRTGIIPDNPEATGSWITVATSGSNGGGTSSGEGAYIPWVYSNGSATGGETTINVPDGTVGVPFIIINGDTQYVGRGFEFNVDNLSVTLAQPLEEGDEVVFLLTGTPAVPDNPHVNDWVQINWLYNNGAAVGGEQVIAIPYTFQSIPAVYKNGLRLYKGLTSESYTADPDNQRILLTEPLVTNDRLIIQIGGEVQVLEVADHTLQEIARATNVKDSEVILSTDSTQNLNDKKIIYSVSEQKAYGLPALPSNIYISSVNGGQLTYQPGGITVDLIPVPESANELKKALSQVNDDNLADKKGASLVGYKSAVNGETTVSSELKFLADNDSTIISDASRVFYSLNSLKSSPYATDGKIVTLISDGKTVTYDVTTSILGNENVDKILLNNGLYAVMRSSVQNSNFSRVGSTSVIGNVRFGDLQYEKRGHYARLLNDLSIYRQPLSVTPTYVDPINGNDTTGTGVSWATAYKTLSKALTGGNNTIYVRGNCILPYEANLSTYTVANNWNIIAVGGPVIAGCVEQGSWGEANGLNVFTPTITGNTPVAVFDTGNFSHLYGYERLTQVSTLALCQSTPSSWFRDSADGYKVYVHTKNGGTVYTGTNRIIVQYARNNYSFVWSGNYRVYFEGFRFFGTNNTGTSGGVLKLSSDGTFRQGVFYAKNCEFSCAYDSAANGLSALDIGIVITENCAAHSNRRDGFNYHEGPSGVSPHFIEVNNIACGNGYLDTASGQNNNNGSTAHETAKGVRINCTYSGSRGPAVKDIDETVTYNAAITTHDSIAGFVVTDTDSRIGNPISYIDGIRSFNNNLRTSGTEAGDITANGPAAFVRVRDAYTGQPAYNTNASTIESF